MNREPRGGDRPRFDPRDRVEISDVRKRGDYYHVTGHVEGRHVSVEIAAPDVESRTHQESEALMRRSLLGTAHQERDAQRNR